MITGMNQIRPASRVAEIEEYYLQRKIKEVAALQAKGIDVVSLGIGGPDRMPPLSAIEALIDGAQKPGVHGYSVTSGLPELREAYACWYERHYGVTLDPDSEILPLIGSKEGILHVSMAFLNPGDAVLVPDPGYPTYTSVSRLMGARVVPYSLTAENGWMPDFDELEKLAHAGVKLMWINYPHMPTGTRPTHELFSRIVDFGRRHGIVIAHDNPYSFILNDEPMSILQVSGASDVAIEMNSLSKSHNMAGWRMGMVASNPQFIKWILKVKSNVDSGQFIPAMRAAAVALSAGDEWYEDLNRVYAERRREAEQIMKTLGCGFDSSQRGLFLWGRIPAGVNGSEEFADSILREARVFVTPGFIFGKNGENYFRISLCATVERLSEARRRISEAINTGRLKF